MQSSDRSIESIATGVLYPVLRPESADYLLGKYAQTVTIPAQDGAVQIQTAPLKMGTTLDLLGISQTDALIDAGIADPTDTLDPNASLQSLIVQTGEGSHKSVYRVCTRNEAALEAPAASFHALNGRQLAVDYDAVISIGSNAELLEGPDRRSHLLTFEARVVGSINLQMGHIGMEGITKNCCVVGRPDDTVVKIIGYELNAKRANLNSRPADPHPSDLTAKSLFYDPNHSGSFGAQITTHTVEGAGSSLEIRVGDEPGAGGGNHRYDVTGFNMAGNPSADFHHIQKLVVLFQNGVIPEVGVNGITIETLLAICEHRLQGFQNGPFACASNQTALDCIRSALVALHSRTRDRLARQVEGKHEK